MPIGVICNVLAVALGGVLGTAGGKRLSEEFRQKLNLIFSICAMGIGISSTVLMQSMPAVILSLILGTIVCYALGTGWFMIQSGRTLADSLTLCVLPFLIPDGIKLALAALIARRTAPLIDKLR